MSCSLAPPENGGEGEQGQAFPVDKAEMGSAHAIMDVSPFFSEALLAKPGLTFFPLQ